VEVAVPAIMLPQFAVVEAIDFLPVPVPTNDALQIGPGATSAITFAAPGILSSESMPKSDPDPPKVALSFESLKVYVCASHVQTPTAAIKNCFISQTCICSILVFYSKL
jgi:hypothetical protein